jgi:hypothetical protein
MKDGGRTSKGFEGTKERKIKEIMGKGKESREIEMKRDGRETERSRYRLSIA